MLSQMPSSSKKKITKRRKSNKMRGGVTRKKLLTRRKVSDLTREIGLAHGGSLNARIKKFVRPALTNQSIFMAVRYYLAGGDRKQRIVDTYGDISQWDVSNVTNMESMFSSARSFNQPLNNWNVSKVTDMRWMFADAEAFNQPLNNWNVSHVTAVAVIRFIQRTTFKSLKTTFTTHLTTVIATPLCF